jgi:hypothetical protein
MTHFKRNLVGGLFALLFLSTGCSSTPKRYYYFECELPNGKVVLAKDYFISYRGSEFRVYTEKGFVGGSGNLTCVVSDKIYTQ